MGAERGDPAGAARVLISGMAAAEAVIALPDQVGSGFITGTSTESEPPWNAGAADAVMVPHQGLRDLEAEVREELGLAPAPRGGSDRNTRDVARWLGEVAPGLSRDSAAYVERKLRAWGGMGLALPSTEPGGPVWLVLDMPGGGEPPDCPYCGTPNLRHHEARGVVACLFTRCPGGGEWAEIDNRGGQLRWRWRDGKVQPDERSGDGDGDGKRAGGSGSDDAGGAGGVSAPARHA